MKRKLITGIVLSLSISLLSGMICPASNQPLAITAQDGAVTKTSELAKASANSEVFLYLGSPLILSEDKISPLDSVNLDVAATVIDNRTFVPLRAVSEYFKADVSYNQLEKQAIITYNGKRYIFPIGEKKYIVEGVLSKKEVSMDTKTTILNERTMVPLRVICEDILDRKVTYHNKIIAIADNAINLKDNKELSDNVKLKIGSALKAQSIEQLKSILPKTDIRRNSVDDYSEFVYFSTSEVADVAVNNIMKAEQSEAKNSTTDFSTTNTQVQGIDEADIVKTDGSYIYIAGNNAVRIVATDKNGHLKDTAVIKLSKDKTVSEIYIDKNRLVLMGTRHETKNKTLNDLKAEVVKNSSQDFEVIDDVKVTKVQIPYKYKNYSFVDVYDISNCQDPKVIKSHEMEGNYQSSRKNGETVYLVTNTYINSETYLPLMKDTTVSTETVSLPIKDIMIMPDCKATRYLVVSALNINNTEKTQVEAIASSSHNTYMNDSALYLVGNNYNGQSIITKFNIAGMNIGYAGSGKVDGYVLNQFSMDEYQGYFRICTTYKNDNNLFILDNSLNVCGSVTGLAKGEQIYSARFIGDKGYIVTFRTMDPLFVFDLSNPNNPKVTGELKIPGFSNYLHPVAKDTLLGIGYDTYDIYKKDSAGKDVVVGTRQGGIKLSLFDVSDMGKPKEISNYVLGEDGSYSDAMYNHKAIMFDNVNNNVAFNANIRDDSDSSNQCAVIFNIDNNKINFKGKLDYIHPDVYGNYIPYGCRILYIGDKLYYIQDGIVSSYNYKTLEKIETLELK